MKQCPHGEASSYSENKFPTFYGIWRLVAVFRRVCHLSQSWAKWIQFMPFHLILFFEMHCDIVLPSAHRSLNLSPSIRFPNQKKKNLCASLPPINKHVTCSYAVWRPVFRALVVNWGSSSVSERSPSGLVSTISCRKFTEQHESEELAEFQSLSSNLGIFFWNFIGWYECVPYFVLLVDRSPFVIDYIRPKLRPAAIQVHWLQLDNTVSGIYFKHFKHTRAFSQQRFSIYWSNCNS